MYLTQWAGKVHAVKMRVGYHVASNHDKKTSHACKVTSERVAVHGLGANVSIEPIEDNLAL